MERKFSKVVTILLLPPLLDQLEIKDERIFLLEFNKITDNSVRINGRTRENLKELAETDFSEKVIELINKQAENIVNLQIILVNYPVSKFQFEKLETRLEDVGIQISKLIVSNLVSFELLVQAKAKNFSCPVCFKAYSRKENFKNEEYLCPRDNRSFSSSQIDQFTDNFTQHYLQNSLEVIQSFALTEKEKGRKMLTLEINLEMELPEKIEKMLLGIIDDEQ